MVAENIAEAETDRLERHPILAEDLQDQADLERERFNAGWNASRDLDVRILLHESRLTSNRTFAAELRRIAEFIRRQRK